MRKNLILTLSIGSMALLASCSSKLGPLSADNFTVDPNPLVAQGGKVQAVVNGNFPVKYMKRKATVTVVPELHYGNGQVARGQAATFQGEKVLGNNQTIAYKAGGRYTMRTTFPYVPEMQSSNMYLTFDARVGNKQQQVPGVLVAHGVVATSELYKHTLMNAGGCIAPDSFQRINEKKVEANIRFLINQANLRRSELKNNSVQEFVKMLHQINADREGLNLRGVEVAAYASPEGGFKLNDKLANKRQDTTEKYVNQQLREAKLAGQQVDAHYTAQDWEGFQQLVQASNIQDKDVILRVLSMYKDPQEREQQIRNMSATFRELADGILPELRRARLIINYETIGRSDDQIQEQLAADPSKLSADELLYAATFDDNAARQQDIYSKAAQFYGDDFRALNNLATLAFNRGDEAKANDYIRQALAKNPNAAEPQGTLALMALKSGKLDEAEAALAKAIDANGFGEVLGNLNIAKGDYAAAVANFNGSETNSAALAQILNKDYAAAVATLKNVKHRDAWTDYLTAIVLNRQGNTAGAKDALARAKAASSEVAAYAANDIEVANLK